MEDKEWKSWASIVRSCLTTSKSPLTAYEIDRDIKMLEGRPVPYRQFKFPNLEAMIHKVPGLQAQQVNGKAAFKVLPSKETEHIIKMVKAQKTKSGRKKLRTVMSRFSAGYKSYPTMSRPQPNDNNIQSRLNGLNVNRSFSAESKKNAQPTPNRSCTFDRIKTSTPLKQHPISSVSQKSTISIPSAPSKAASLSIQTRLSPSPLMQQKVEMPKSKVPQRLNIAQQRPIPVSTHPISSVSQKSTISMPSAPPKTANLSIQSRLSPSPLMQQKVEMPKSKVPERLNIAQQRPISMPTHPISSISQKPIIPTPSVPPKASRFSIQSTLSPPPLMQQKVEMPKSKVAQRLNIAQQRPTSMPKIDDPRLRLNNYTDARKLPLPKYIDATVKNDKHIYSLVIINDKKYSSYPKEAKTKDEAEKLAAQAALDALVENTTLHIITKDKALILKRVVDIVKDYPNGIFETRVIETYRTQHGERLPKDWLAIVEHAVTVDVGTNDLNILSSLSKNIGDNRSPTTDGHSRVPLDSEPAILKLDNMAEFWLHIYVVYGTTDIWGVIINENHSDKVDELAKEMKDWYDINDSTVPQVIPDKYYSVLDSEWYHRVRCMKVNPETKEATVFFIDRGDEDVVSIKSLRSLRHEFCQLPAQSVRLSMMGLEAFEGCEETQPLLEEMLIDKDVFVRNINFGSKEVRYMNTVPAELYFDLFDEVININEDVKEKIFKLLDPNSRIGTDKLAQQGFISNVTDEKIFVQLKFVGLELLNNLMDKLTKDYLKNFHFKTKPVSRFDPTKIYVTENLEDRNWHRVKINTIINENEAQVTCIDVGNSLKINKERLVLLEDLSDILARFPKQALQIQMHKISSVNFDKKMAAHLRKLAPKTDLFYLKIVGIHKDIPIVEIYKRTEDNYLASLNDTLALEPEIQLKDDNNNTKSRIRNDRLSMGEFSGFPLKVPNILPINSFFDVYVTMAAHPGNFTVQPLNSVTELQNLMVELSKICNSYTGPPLTPSAVKVGNMYAAKHDDGQWYRAYASKLISKNICVVYFCDYGDYRAVSLDLLQPLKNQFYDLPYQALKAKLHGITPKSKNDWSVKDVLRFNELIVTRNFVSIVKCCDVSNIQLGDPVLSIELIDTSTDVDINISNILINENRADKVDGIKV